MTDMTLAATESAAAIHARLTKLAGPAPKAHQRPPQTPAGNDGEDFIARDGKGTEGRAKAIHARLVKLVN